MSGPLFPLPMVFVGDWVSMTQAFTAGQVVNYSAGGPTAPTLWFCKTTYNPTLSPWAGMNIVPSYDFPQYWRALSPNLTQEVNQLNGSTGAVSIVSNDGSVSVSNAGAGVNGTVSLGVVKTGLQAVGGNAQLPNTGVTLLTSLDGTVTITQGTPGLNGSMFFSARQLATQSILDAGVYDNAPTTTAVVAPSVPLLLVQPTLLGYTYFGGPWLSGTPVAPIVPQITLKAGAKYTVSGLLSVSYSVVASAALNLALNIKGRPLSSGGAVVVAQMPQSPSVFRVTNGTGSIVSGTEFVPVSVTFTAPDSIATLPNAQGFLGMDAFITGLLTGSTCSVQWLGSFSCLQVFSPSATPT